MDPRSSRRRSRRRRSSPSQHQSANIINDAHLPLRSDHYNSSDDDDNKYAKKQIQQQEQPHPLEKVLQIFIGTVLVAVCWVAASNLGWTPTQSTVSGWLESISSSSSSTVHPSLRKQQQQQHRVAKERHTATVTIIGAGAAGLSAARYLQSSLVANVVVLEASNVLGGRVRRDTTFLNRHRSLDVGATMVGDVDLVESFMNNKDQNKEGNKRKDANDGDQKEGDDGDEEEEVGRVFGIAPIYEVPYFLNYSYYDFVADHMAPPVQDDIIYNCVVDRVEHGDNTQDRSSNDNERDHNSHGPQVHVWCGDDRLFVSQYVIVTVPLTILKDGDIDFVPPLPANLTWNHPGDMYRGFKVFLQFSYNFFEGDGSCFETDCSEQQDGEIFFWDAGLQQMTKQNIMKGFVMGKYLGDFYGAKSEQDIVQNLLDRLDGPFEGLASRHYLDHFLFNWTAQPHIRGTYPSRGLVGPHKVNQRLFVAGDAFPVKEDEAGWVHGAIHSGTEAARQVVSLLSSDEGALNK